MMMTTKKLITSDDPRGRQATDLFRGAYNKAELTEEQAQSLNENRGGQFTTELLQIIQKHSLRIKYANEEMVSNLTYPKEYLGPRPILDQVLVVASIFDLHDWSKVMEFGRNLPALPEGAEGWFAIPKVSSIAKYHFPEITDPATQYCEAVKLVHQKLVESRDFTNHRNVDAEIIPAKFHQCAHTIGFMERLEAEQAGDILILPVQYGMKHRGKTKRRAFETFSYNEFGLGAFAVGCMGLVHQNRYIRFHELDTECADEFSPKANGVFTKSVAYGWSGTELMFWVCDEGDVSANYGLVSAFEF